MGTVSGRTGRTIRHPQGRTLRAEDAPPTRRPEVSVAEELSPADAVEMDRDVGQSAMTSGLNEQDHVTSKVRLSRESVPHRHASSADESDAFIADGENPIAPFQPGTVGSAASIDARHKHAEVRLFGMKPELPAALDRTLNRQRGDRRSRNDWGPRALANPFDAGTLGEGDFRREDRQACSECDQDH